MKMTIVLLVVLGIIAGICAVALVKVIIPSLSGSGQDVTVVMAVRDLPKGTRLASDDLKLGTYPRNQLPSDRYLDNIALAVNRTLSEEVDAEIPLMTFQLETVGSIQDAVSKLKDGERAVSVMLSNSQVTGSLLYAGCFVDVLATFRARGGSSRGVTKTLLRQIEVLAIEGQLGNPDDEDERGGRTSRSGRGVAVTLRLDANQAEVLNLAAENAVLSVSMRSPTDTLPLPEGGVVYNPDDMARFGQSIGAAVRDKTQPGSAGKSSTWKVKMIRGKEESDTEVKAK